MVNDHISHRFMKKLFSVLVTLVAIFSTVGTVSAHVVVKPATTGVGSFTDFSLGVPSEENASTIGVKLMIPAGLKNISPIVKPGWKIEVVSTPDPSQVDDDGNPAKIVSEIDWTGGAIPTGQKDFFSFSAQVPAQETTLIWKVYQTYSNEEVKAWDTDPNAVKVQQSPQDGADMNTALLPYSQTKVVNDLKASASPVSVTQTSSSGNSNNSAQGLAIAALALAVISLVLQFKKKTV